MLKKTVTYTNWNGEEVTEDFWFHLSKSECVEMTYTTPGGFDAYIKRIVAAKDVPTLIKEWKKLVLMAYGKKSADGKRFMKDDEIRREFVESPAYDIIFMEFVTDDKAAAEFVNGILPEMPKDHQPPAQQ